MYLNTDLKYLNTGSIQILDCREINNHRPVKNIQNFTVRTAHCESSYALSSNYHNCH